MAVDPTQADPQVPHPPPPSSDGASARKVGSIALLAIVVVAAGLLFGFFGPFRHWFALHTGILKGGPDVYYNFWSGFGSDLGEATLISAVLVGLYTGVRRVNCHTKGCWRIGRHRLDGTPYVLCRHHHPEVPNDGASHAHILREYQRVRKEAQDAAGTSRGHSPTP